MRIRWANIFGLLLVSFCIYLFVKLKPYLDRLFDDLADNYYSGYYDYSPTMKIAVFSLICVTLVAVIKIIMRK
jgi:hypothetical protein